MTGLPHSQDRPALDELQNLPGHRIRRLQQIAVALFMQETSDSAITPVQYAVLHALNEHPGVDQRSLSRLVSFDTSTIGGVIDRLEARGTLTRSQSPTDRRVRLLNLTDKGRTELTQITQAMMAAQNRMLEPLDASERAQFMAMMARIIAHHERDGC